MSDGSTSFGQVYKGKYGKFYLLIEVDSSLPWPDPTQKEGCVKHAIKNGLRYPSQ